LYRCSIIVLDSLNVPRTKPYLALRSYLLEEAKAKKPELFRNGQSINLSQIKVIKNPKVPVQPNHYDCGVYVIKYVQTILGDPDFFTEYLLVWSCVLYFLLTIFDFHLQRGISDKSAWFTYDDIQNLRREVFSLMKRLQKDYKQKHPGRTVPEVRSAAESNPSKSTRAGKKQKIQSNESSDIIIIDD
jgi:Ulp1 family protease